ncbi:hypothetical protein SeGA_4245, partial [Salmonella enterica subsp. enterica serovar Gaminara str. A4-567]
NKKTQIDLHFKSKNKLFSLINVLTEIKKILYVPG